MSFYCRKTGAVGSDPIRYGASAQVEKSDTRARRRQIIVENAKHIASATERAANRVMRETVELERRAAPFTYADPIAKAAFYKAALDCGSVEQVCKRFEGLGAIPEATIDLGLGERLLPSVMSLELLTEPLDDNPLRRMEMVSQITALEEPKLLFEIQDASLDDMTDAETAREIRLEGDSIQYGRYKTKISATIKDTVLHGSPLNLASSVEKTLRSALATKEKMRAFAIVPDGKHDHMSFYLRGIKHVCGENLIMAIINCIGDLPDAFSENVEVTMRKIDYDGALRILANGDETLLEKKPEDIIGYPVVFNERARIPVVGDFHYARQNYDRGVVFETDKDTKKGEHYFVLTAWGDHQIRLKSAFRLAIVRIELLSAVATSETTGRHPGEKLHALAIFNVPGAPASSISYKWQRLNGAIWTDNNTHTGNATAELLTIENTDANASFRCKVIYTDGVNCDTVFSNVVKMAAE